MTKTKYKDVPWKSLEIEHGGWYLHSFSKHWGLYIYSEVQLVWLITANSLFVSLFIPMNYARSINFLLQITALKTQMENDAKTIDRLNTEKSQILGQIVELRAKITSLEGQVYREKNVGDQVFLSGHCVMLFFNHFPRGTICTSY